MELSDNEGDMVSTPRRLVGILFSLALVLGFAPASAEPTFPMLSGRVVDDANLMGPADKQRLTADLEALEDKSSDQVVVVTLPSLQGYGPWSRFMPPNSCYSRSASHLFCGNRFVLLSCRSL